MLMIIKSRSPDETEKLPLKEKLRLILTERVKEAKTDEDRKAAERQLAKLTEVPK
ncbi:hypothetical protein JQ617_02355 [Bradyrhizobium sp. KB893862 SZCCT0404]|uniref:hypothetical protein n=1 Tax=Bradyrhizobium sp. KB893862 SZCCT0404 TaxID=2807672 RepID=UPI001BA97779|nr:hypothetical protein [Bradyrhizobium sp. KB893862 SZCCT0404]MBR1172785.1 hypothetical protein [Bradyrhizobium sp. KB893862 SZCCT0404]